MTGLERLAVRALAVYYGLGAAAGVVLAGIIALAFAPNGAAVAPFLLGFAALLAAAARGLWLWRRWAWFVGAGLAVLAVAAGILRVLAPPVLLGIAAPDAAALLVLFDGLSFLVNAAALYALLRPAVRRRFFEGAPVSV